MKQSIRNGLRAGTIFSIAIIFLIMIGFLLTISELIHDMLGGEFIPGEGSIPGLLVVLTLLGLWAGAMGAKREEPDTWKRAILAGFSSGFFCGLIVGIFAIIMGISNDKGLDLRPYLTQMSSTAINFLLLGKGTIEGALLNFGLLTLTGTIGGILARGIGRGSWRASVSQLRENTNQSISSYPVVKQISNNRYAQYLPYGLVLIVVLIMPLYLGQYWNFTLGTVGIYVLMGLGLNIVVGMAGLLDLGYVAFFAVGAYTMGLLTSPQPHGIMWNFWMVLPLAVLFASLAGFLLGIPVLRLRGDYLAIVTLGFGEIIRVLLKSDALTPFSGGPQGVRDISGPTLFGKPFSNERDFMYLIILGIILVIFVTIRLQNSRVGRSWIAMREDETVARAMGIDTYRTKLLAFAIGAAFAGLGGLLFAARNQYTGPEDHNLLVSINVLCLVIVGGMGSIPGVIVGAFALKGLPEILRQISDYRILAFGALLVVMMVIRPEGLWPSKRRSLEVGRLEEGNPPQTVPKESAVAAVPSFGNTSIEGPPSADTPSARGDIE